MQIKSVNLVKAPSLKKYSYNISNDFTFSCKIGRIYPVSIIDCIPGDTIVYRNEHFGRAAPMVHPILQHVNINFHKFFVPYRLIYPDLYDKVLTSPTNESASFPMLRIHPTVVFNTQGETLPTYYGLMTLAEFFGAPVATWQKLRKDNKVDANDYFEISLAPFIAYILLWNEYFRDSLKQEEISFDMLNFNQSFIQASTFVNSIRWNDVLLKANYPRDYFNTSQYTPQLGESITLPLNGSVSSQFTTPANPSAVANSFVVVKNKESQNQNGQQVTNIGYTNSNVENGAVQQLSIRNVLNMDELTINKLKELFALQNWADIGNMFGKRYIEQVLGHFGVRSSDARLQRPDYLGSSSSPLQISEVTQLSETTSNSPLGEMAGRGITYGGSRNDDYFCEEHGYFITLMSVMPQQSYMNGTPRYLLKKSTFDFAFPEFANIGEQEVYEREIFDTQDATGVFGYQERYAEYKRSYNRVAGEFARTLKAFTMGIDLLDAVDAQGRPITTASINQILSPDDTDVERVFAVENSDHLYMTIKNDVTRHSVLPYVERNITNIL